MDFTFFEEGDILRCVFQERYGQQLLNMAIVRIRSGQFHKTYEVCRNHRVRERVSKLRQEPAATSETTEVDNKLDSGLQDY